MGREHGRRRVEWAEGRECGTRPEGSAVFGARRLRRPSEHALEKSWSFGGDRVQRRYRSQMCGCLRMPIQKANLPVLFQLSVALYASCNDYRRTIDEFPEVYLGHRVSALESQFDIVPMPVGSIVRSLVVHIGECSARTDIASSCALLGGSFDSCVWLRFLWLIDSRLSAKYTWDE